MKRRDKTIRYTPYAKDRMRSRGITEQQARRVVRDYDVIRPAHRPNRRRYEKKFSKKKRITVIAEERARSFLVVSAW